MIRNAQTHALLLFLSDLEKQITGLPDGYQEVSKKFEQLREYIDQLVSTSEKAQTTIFIDPKAINLFSFEKNLSGAGGMFSNAILVIDASDRITFANPKITKLLNASLESLEGKLIWQVFPELVGTPLQEHLKIVKVSHQAASALQQGEIPDAWYEVKMYPVQDTVVLLWVDKLEENQYTLQYQRIYQEFKEKQELLQQTVDEAQLHARINHEANIQTQAIFNNLIAVAVLQEQSGVIQMANSYAIALFGFDPLHLRAESVFEKLQIRDENGAIVPYNGLPTGEAAQGSVVQNRKLFITNPRGRTYTVLVSSMPVQIGKQITGVVSVWNDITRQEKLLNEQRKMEEQRVESAIQLEVQRRLLEHRENERQEIARDLHDGPIQSIISNLFNLQRTKEEINDPEVHAIINQVVLSLKSSVQDLRDVVNELRPPVVLHLGLARAIRIHAQDIQSKNAGLILHLDLIDDEKLLPEKTCLALYRIYQESINNILRHSRASEASVRYSFTGQLLTLEIVDNGQGFAIPADWNDLIQKNHFGIPGMQERAGAIGGKMSVSSKPGAGTRVRVEVPLTKEQIDWLNAFGQAS